jgi:hypothetical protein
MPDLIINAKLNITQIGYMCCVYGTCKHIEQERLSNCIVNISTNYNYNLKGAKNV